MGSIRLFKLFGIKLELHFTFVLLLLWLIGTGYAEEGVLGALSYGAAIILLFTCVVLHELGHSFAARHYGIPTRRILLMPIGGMAQFTHIPREPKKELVISIAGPAVNALFVLILYPLEFYVLEDGTPLGGMVSFLYMINFYMLLFNLLPVFPMDGGRVLRALLVFRMSYIKATKIAAGLGRSLAILGMLFAFLAYTQPNWILAILFGFIYMAGTAEYKLICREEEWKRWMDDEK